MAAEHMIFAAAFAELLTRAALVDFASAAGLLGARGLLIEHLVVTAAGEGALRLFEIFIGVDFPTHVDVLSSHHSTWTRRASESNLRDRSPHKVENAMHLTVRRFALLRPVGPG
jgi:hypothetical protein